MIFVIESIVVCVIFTVMILSSMKNPLNQIYSYPPNIVKRVAELGLIEDTNPQVSNRWKAIRKKWPMIILFGIMIGVLVYFINDAHSFLKGFGVSYGVWLVVDWYDAFFLDMIWFCHSKKVRIPGTEDMVRDYHDYWFHIRSSFVGMLLGLPACLIAGVVCHMLP